MFKVQRQKRPISPEGKTIKAMLIELGMTQAEFCRKYDIPQNRLSDIIHTDVTSRRMIPYRLKIYQILKELSKEVAG